MRTLVRRRIPAACAALLSSCIAPLASALDLTGTNVNVANDGDPHLNVSASEHATFAGPSVVPGALTVVAGTGITATAAPLIVFGSSSFVSTSGPIQLWNDFHDFLGPVSVTGVDMVGIRDSNAITLGAVSAPNVTVGSSGAITQSAALNVPAFSALSGHGAVTLNHPNNDFGAFSGNAGSGAISIRDQNGIVLESILASSLTVHAEGPITQSASAIAVVANFTSSTGPMDLPFGNFKRFEGTTPSSILLMNSSGLEIGSSTALHFWIYTDGAVTVAPGANVDVGSNFSVHTTGHPFVVDATASSAFGTSCNIDVSSLLLQGRLKVPALVTGTAIHVQAPVATVNVTLDLGPLPLTPAAETRLHVFAWNGTVPALNVTPGTLPTLPPSFSYDFSELGTTGDIVLRQCGDGQTNGTEVCDDGNTTTELACAYGTASCTFCNATCTAVLSLTGGVCGDNVQNPDEACDDGNAISETACPYGTATCTKCNATCTAVLDLTGPTCGDHVTSDGEICDDGNTATETACPYGTATCTACNGMCNAVLNLTGRVCGDGVQDPEEACDDGNTVGGDGCSPLCTVEPTAPPSADAGAPPQTNEGPIDDDAGANPIASTEIGGGGCASASGPASSGAAWSALLFALALVLRRRS